MVVEIGHGPSFYTWGETTTLDTAANYVDRILTRMESEKKARGKAYEIALDIWKEICKDQEDLKAKLAPECARCGHNFQPDQERFIISGKAICRHCLRVRAKESELKNLRDGVHDARHSLRVYREQIAEKKEEIRKLTDLEAK